MPLVTITLSRPDLQPPVSVAGTFTGWQPVQLDHLISSPASGAGLKHLFLKTFDIAPGEHQYKYRLGEGDWWICDSSVTRVHDSAGNENNFLSVEDKPIPSTSGVEPGQFFKTDGGSVGEQVNDLQMTSSGSLATPNKTSGSDDMPLFHDVGIGQQQSEEKDPSSKSYSTSDRDDEPKIQHQYKEISQTDRDDLPQRRVVCKPPLESSKSDADAREEGFNPTSKESTDKEAESDNSVIAKGLNLVAKIPRQFLSNLDGNVDDPLEDSLLKQPLDRDRHYGSATKAQAASAMPQTLDASGHTSVPPSASSLTRNLWRSWLIRIIFCGYRK